MVDDGVATEAQRDRDEQVLLTAGRISLPGRLTLPRDAAGIVVFAEDFAGTRCSACGAFTADVLHRARLGSLRVDLLTRAEEFFGLGIVDVPLLARRLGAVTGWLADNFTTRDLPVGYLGMEAGAAAALSAAARAIGPVTAVVCAGGWPHLAGPLLPSVRAPSLLIVGSRDQGTLTLNQRAQHELTCENRLVVIPDAAHPFEEPAVLRWAADLTRDWFHTHLGPSSG